MPNAHLKAWLIGARPKTLSAAVMPVLVGTALSANRGYAVRWWISLAALASAVFIQIGTNLFNDALDFARGADTSERTGPTRVTQSGLLPKETVLRGGAIAFCIALIFSIPLVIVGGWPIVAIGLLSLLAGYAYTGGPFPLAYRGVGEVFVILFFGIIAVAGVVFLQTGQWPVDARWAGVQVGCLAAAILAINNLRDWKTDQQSSKWTLAARFGVEFGRVEIASFILIPFAMGSRWFFAGNYFAACLPLLALPVAVPVIAGVVRHEPSSHYNLYLVGASLLEVVFALLLAGGFFWG